MQSRSPFRFNPFAGSEAPKLVEVPKAPETHERRLQRTSLIAVTPPRPDDPGVIRQGPRKVVVERVRHVPTVQEL